MTAARNITYGEALQMVSDFQEATDCRLSLETRLRIIEEELAEYREAFSHLLKEAADLMYVMLGAVSDGHDIPDELSDRIGYVLEPLIPHYQDTLNEAFRRVHESNMSKFVDGKALKRDDGKILKGPNYQPPNLDDLAPGGRS